MGDFNVNYSNPRDDRSDQIVTAMQMYNLHDLSKNFKTKKPYTWTWRMFREGRQIKSICDYILYGDGLKGRWKNFKVVNTLIDTDHRLIKGVIEYKSTKKYKFYR